MAGRKSLLYVDESHAAAMKKTQAAHCDSPPPLFFNLYVLKGVKRRGSSSCPAAAKDKSVHTDKI